MSMERTVDITCPNCGKPSDFVIWQSINTIIDPQMKQAVRDRSAFAFTCPYCGQTRNVDYGFLYHQMEDNIMIHYATSDKDVQEILDFHSKAASLDPMLIDLRKENYMVRIVRSQNHLLEKLAIIDAGLDDRLVEIYKIFLLADIQQENPDMKDIEVFMFNDDSKHYLQVLSEQKNVGYVEMSMKTYHLLSEKLSAKLPSRSAQEPFVDRQWAVEFLQLG